MKMLKYCLSTILFLVTLSLSSQPEFSIQNFLTENSEKSSQVFEGTIEKIERTDSTDKCTLIIKASKSFKGDTNLYNEVLLDFCELSEGDEGIFFLDIDSTNDNTNFIFINFIEYLQYPNGPVAIMDYYSVSEIGNKIYRPLESINGQIEVLSPNIYEQNFVNIQDKVDCLEYSVFEPRINVLENGSKYEFEFKLRMRFSSTSNGIYLASSDFSFTYPKNLFGDNIASNQRLDITKSSNLANYDIQFNDLSDDRIAFNIMNTNNDFIYVDQYFIEVLTARIEIDPSELSNTENLAISANPNGNSSHYFNKQIIPLPCTEIIDGNEVSLLTTPQITSVTSSDLPAGTRELKSRLIINGSNFGSQTLSSEVIFQSVIVSIDASNSPSSWTNLTVSNLPGDIESWTEEEIIVYVPSRGVVPGSCSSNCNFPSIYTLTATSGIVQVSNDAGNTSSSENESARINVPWAATNSLQVIGDDNHLLKPMFLTGNQFNVVVTDEVKGFVAENLISDNVPVKEVIEEALDIWCNATQLNFILDWDFTVTDNCIPDVNAILFKSFDNNASATATGQLIEGADTNITGIEATCLACDRGTVRIKNNMNESLLLGSIVHELGHAHGLAHCETGTMAPRSSDQLPFEVIDQNAIDASSYIQDVSLQLGYSQNTTCITSVKDILLVLKI